MCMAKGGKGVFKAVLQPKNFPYVVISIFSMVLVCIDYYHQQMTEDLELQSQRSL